MVHAFRFFDDGVFDKAFSTRRLPSEHRAFARHVMPDDANRYARRACHDMRAKVSSRVCHLGGHQPAAQRSHVFPGGSR